MQIRKDQDLTNTPGPPRAKRSLSEDDSPIAEKNAAVAAGTHIRISNRGKTKEKCTNMILFTRKETNLTFAYQNVSPFKSNIFYLLIFFAILIFLNNISVHNITCFIL